MTPSTQKALTIDAVTSNTQVILMYKGRAQRYKYLFRDTRVALFQNIEIGRLIELELDPEGFLRWGSDAVRILRLEAECPAK